MKAERKLTPKQRRFVDEYLIDLNAGGAARRAGFSPRTAARQGEYVVHFPHVAAEIARRQAVLAKKAEVTIERVIRELALIAFANMQDYLAIGPDGQPTLNWAGLTRNQAAALAEVTVDEFTEKSRSGARDVRRVKFRLSDKQAALVSLGKHLGIFVERHEITGNLTVTDARERNIDLIESVARRAVGAALAGDAPRGDGSPQP